MSKACRNIFKKSCQHVHFHRDFREGLCLVLTHVWYAFFYCILPASSATSVTTVDHFARSRLRSSSHVGPTVMVTALNPLEHPRRPRRRGRRHERQASTQTVYCKYIISSIFSRQHKRRATAHIKQQHTAREIMTQPCVAAVKRFVFSCRFSKRRQGMAA